jgi:hypothetical protein
MQLNGLVSNSNSGEETVKTHLQNIYRKLDAKGRVAAPKAAHGLGFTSHTTDLTRLDYSGHPAMGSVV